MNWLNLENLDTPTIVVHGTRPEVRISLDAPDSEWDWLLALVEEVEQGEENAHDVLERYRHRRFTHGRG